MFAVNANLPTAVLFEAVVFASRACSPIAVLFHPVVLADKELYPMPTELPVSYTHLTLPTTPYV